MNDLRRADHYRARAIEMRELARRATSEDVKTGYLALANQWELLAVKLKDINKP